MFFKHVADSSPQWAWGKASRHRLAAHSSGLSAVGTSIWIHKPWAATRSLTREVAARLAQSAERKTLNLAVVGSVFMFAFVLRD
jgi:hypothetical protein